MDNTNSTPAIASDGCTLTEEEIIQSYNLTLHVVSVFVLLTVSFLGASFSVASTRVKRLHVNPIIINTGKWFGSGVVLATGFVHILPDGMAALTDPCLPASWNVYSAYGGLFAMLAALGMQLIEFLAHQRYRSMKVDHTHGATNMDVKEVITNEQINDKTNEATSKEPLNNGINDCTCIEHVEYENEKPKKKKRVNGEIDEIKNIEANSDTTEESDKEEQIIDSKEKSVIDETNNPEEMQQTSDETENPKEKKQTHHEKDKSTAMKVAHIHIEVPGKTDHNHCVAIEILNTEPTLSPIDHCEGSGHYHGAAFEDENQRNKISTYLLELGIALHSVLIGLTLGTTTESFVPLFIALCFHQFFEAIALGAQIANLKTSSIKTAIFMIVFYSLTTPVGIAVGIGIHAGTYNPKSTASLLTTGILDSLSAGILIYVALVNLITAEMGSNAHAFHSLRTPLKFLYFIALYLGVAAMSVIGRWA